MAPTTGSSSLSASTSQSATGTGMSSTASSSGGYEIKIDVKTEDERLRMGLTAKCSIILEEVRDVYAVPYDAIQENSEGSTVVYVSEKTEKGYSSKEILVEKGMESDYYVEISGDELRDGLQILIPTDEVSINADEKLQENEFEMFGGGAPEGGGREMMKGGSGNEGMGNAGNGSVGNAKNGSVGNAKNGGGNVR